MKQSIDSYTVRKIILDQAYRAHVGHIGSALSVTDIMVVVYTRLMELKSHSEPDRDRFILSKGHAVLNLYAILYLYGWISETELNSYCGSDTLFGVHPERALDGIDFCTGSLGQGLSIGVGSALAAKIQGSQRKVYVLISDAECNEGSVWEAAQFAAHHQLDNLFVIVDYDGQQALDYTKNVLSPNHFEDRWRAFGWDVHEMDGHRVDAMAAAIQSAAKPAPHVFIAKTTFGKGVSFMEGQIKWHYLPMTDEQYAQALHEIKALRP
jgi:transketolase